MITYNYLFAYLYCVPTYNYALTYHTGTIYTRKKEREGYIYIYIHTYMHTYIHILYIYVYIYVYINKNYFHG
jgi:hypothetical protein